MTSRLVLALWMFLSGIELVVPERSSVKTTFEPLQYWVRDPALEINRRSNQDPDRQNFPLSKIFKSPRIRNLSYDETEPELLAIPIHVEDNTITKLYHKIQTRSVTPKRKVYNKNSEKISYVHRPKKNLRMGWDHSEPWPGVQKSFKTKLRHVEDNTITKLYHRLHTRNVTPKGKAYNIDSENISYVHRPEKSLRMGWDHSEPWPRLQKSFKKYRSTMMMMVSNDDVVPNAEPLQAEKKKHNDDDNDSTKVLRQYTLRQQLEKFTDEFPEANVTLEVLGRTIEYNDIIMLKVTEKKSDNDRHFRADENKYEDDVPEKKIVFIVHGLSVMGLHNIPSLVKVCRLRQLMSYYFEHLDKFDIFLIPVANPDGYGIAISNHINMAGVSLWFNKNNSPQSVCNGVALDRNFEVAWNDSGASHSCSPQYPGPKAFSEPETRAVRDVLNRYGHKIAAYIHVHASTYDPLIKKGEAVLYPKGYTEIQSEDDKYIDLKGEIEEMMKNASFKYLSVTVDSLYSWYGKVSGTSVDYASTVYSIPYSLEFLMQPYDEFIRFSERFKFPDDKISQAALEHVWKRVIDATFNTIHRNVKNNDL